MNRHVSSLIASGVLWSFLPGLTSWSSEPAAVAPSPASAMEQGQQPTGPAAPLTLADCYTLALKRSETIAINQELIKETEGRFLQALSGALPRVTFSSSDERQDGSGGSAFTLRHVPNRRFVFSQPLFSGFKEFAAIAGSRAERRQRIEEKTRAEHLLFVDVSDAFYFVLEHREDLGALEASRLALVQRLDELKERERLGRSRPSEVASAEAKLRRVEADLERVRSDERLAHELLKFLTGLDRIEELADTAPVVPALDPADGYIAKASVRPDLRAAEEAWHVAEKALTVARAKFWPTVGVDGNYYVERGGIAKDVNWDVTLKVDVPLFQGGQAVGETKEAASHARQAKLRYEQRQRSVALDIRDAYTKLTSSIAVTTALEKALQAAEEDYRLQTEDYRLNLVSNLDVLQALQALQDARRDFVQAMYQTKRLYSQLRVAIGETL